MNLKSLLSKNNFDFLVDYTPTSPESIYDDCISINFGKKWVNLFVGKEYNSLLHFLGLDNNDIISNGRKCCSHLLELFSAPPEDKTVLYDTYISLCNEQPIFYIYLKGVYRMMHNKPSGCVDDIKLTLERYDDMQKYVQDILITPYKQLRTIKPIYIQNVAEHLISKYNKKESVFLEFSAKYQSFDRINAFQSIGEFTNSWMDYAKSTDLTDLEDENNYSYLHQFATPPEGHMYVVFLDFISYMVEQENIIMECSLCHRNFIGKYYSKTNYCRRIYNNTVSTCQEYASIQQYQSKKQENPIYALSLKCYNKLYSRVRKGKIEKDSELFSQLYELRDSYMKKYHDAPSDDLVKEFEELTKKL